MLIKAQAEVLHRREFQIAIRTHGYSGFQRLRMNLMWNTNKNTWRSWYIVKENFGITTHYDSDMGMGFGLSLNY
jgi:hypothetical protein